MPLSDQLKDQGIANRKKVLAILEANKDKNFIDRILNNDRYPALRMGPMGPGEIGTHLMSWSSVNDGGAEKYIVYPEIVWNGKELKRLDRKEAVSYAKKTGEYVEFKSPEEADWFGKNYKYGIRKQFESGYGEFQRGY